MLWTNKKFGKTGARRALGLVLLFLLCGLFSLSCSLPASAATAWTSCESTATVYRNGVESLANGTINLKQFYGTSSYSGVSTNWRINFNNCSWTNQYSTHQHFYASFSVVFQVDDQYNWGYVWSSGLSARDNQNYWSVESDEVTSVSYQSGSSNYIVFTHLIQGSVQPNQAINFDFNGVVLGVNKLQSAYNLSYMISDLRVSFSEDIDQNILRQLQNQSSDISSIKSLVEQIKNNSSVAGVISQQQATNNKLDSVNNNLNSVDSDIKAQTQQEHQDAQKQLEESKKQTENQQATNDKLDREYNQDQQDRSDAEDAVDNSQTSADDSQASLQNSSQSLLDAMGATVNLIRDTPATNCKIPIDTGNLDLGEVDLCSVPNDVKQLINRVFGLVMIVGGLLLSLNIFHAAMDLFAQATGYSYNPPTVTGGKK